MRRHPAQLHVLTLCVSYTLRCSAVVPHQPLCDLRRGPSHVLHNQGSINPRLRGQGLV